jgi:hypothetical protein
MSTNPYQMPIRSTVNAPKFNGTIVDISQYFDDFDQHADNTNLMLKPRIKAALRYISRDDAETWETLPEASGDDYAVFVKAVKEQLYPGWDEKPDYSKSDLEFIVTKQAKKPMYTMEDLGQYDRLFCPVSTSLISNKRIAETKQNHLYLDGFHSDIKTQILHRLEYMKPDIRPKHSYPQIDVNKAA